MIILPFGNFGLAVAARWASIVGGQWMPFPRDRQSLATVVAKSSFVAVATWRPCVAQCEALDQLCFQHGKRWSLAEVHGRRLTVGPLVMPGHGPCYTCYRKRWLCGHPAPERELVLDQEFGRDEKLGPGGFVDPMVEIAAHGLAIHSEAGVGEAGRIRVVDVLTAAVQESTVIGVHECPRCRTPRHERTGDRFVRSLIPTVEGIFA